jgi:hypothetical protein
MEDRLSGGVASVTAGGTPASGGGTRRADAAASAILFTLVLLGFAARTQAQYRPLTYLVGDCPYYAATTVSILEDHDLDLRNQLRGGLDVHGRQIALGRSGAWYPKHPILMPIVALPFVAAFGIPGTLVFNLLVLALLALALMRLARQAARPWPAACASFLLIAGSFLREYGYNFSPDLFATLIFVLGLLWLVRGRDAAGGLLLGLAVCAKITNLFLWPLGVLYSGWCRGWRGVLRAALGSAGPLVALGALNLALFGSPFVTSYDRNIVMEDGRMTTVSHRGLFDRGVLDGVTGELLDPIHGLLPTSPVLFLALPGSVLLFRKRPREALLYLAVAEFLLLLFATYRYWSSSHYGNRFLMPLVAVASPAVALAVQWIIDGARRTFHRTLSAPAGAST